MREVCCCCLLVLSGPGLVASKVFSIEGLNSKIFFICRGINFLPLAYEEHITTVKIPYKMGDLNAATIQAIHT